MGLMARHYGFPIRGIEIFKVGRKSDFFFFFLRRELFLRRVSFRYNSIGVMNKNND